MSSRIFQDVFKTSSQDVLKTPSKRLGRRNIFTLKSYWRRLQDQQMFAGVFLEVSQNSQENTCARDYFLIKLQATLIKKKLCEFCETSKNTFFHRNTARGCFWISKKMLLQAFSDTANWIYNIQKNKMMHCKRFEHIPIVSSVVIFLTTIEYGTFSSSIDSNELFIWVFSHSIIRGWLTRASNAIGCSCNR